MIPVFGEMVPGRPYVLRPGGYAVIRREPGEVGIVQTPDGFFLIGGGLEGDESPEQALLREAQEECGLVLRIASIIGCADELVFAEREQTYFRRSGTFFRADIV